MNHAIKPLIVLLAIVFLMQSGAFIIAADDNSEEVSIAGVLKVMKKKSGSKTQAIPYIQNGDTKTLIKLDIANKGQRPSLKKYLKKRIVIKGLGKQKMVKDKNVVIFTKVTSINEVASADTGEGDDIGDAVTKEDPVDDTVE